VLEFLAFGAVVALRTPGADGGEIAAYRGAGRRAPWLGAAFVLAVAGLAGLPPGLAGLFAKVTIVDSLIHGGWGWLAAVVAVNAVIALAYYIRVAATLYAGPAPAPAAVAGSRSVGAALWVFAAVAVVLGFAPQVLFDRLTR
jgi:NADH-quinone oxidoreductase subunit N